MSLFFYNPIMRAIDSSNRPLPGAKLTFWKAGTTTPQNVYADSSLATPLSNPVIADAAGEFVPIYMDDTVNYRVRLESADGVLQFDVDPYECLCAGGGGDVAPILVVAGSSNARSFSSTTAGLPANLSGPLSGVMIWDIVAKQWVTYEATVNSDLYNSTNAWGPEAELARQFRLSNPGKTLYLLKIGKDSASLSPLAAGNSGAWLPSADELFSEMTSAITEAKANLVAQGEAPSVEAVVFFAGGVDANTESAANAFESDMQSFVSSVRTDWGSSSTKVIIPRLLDRRTHASTIRAAQVAVADADELVEWFDTDFYPTTSDEDHYLDPGIVAMGFDAFHKYNGTYPGLLEPQSPTFANVSLLAGFDGVDGATTYTEESNAARSATFVGNAQLDTDASQVIYGSACALFDGSGDAITFPDSVDFHLGSSPFVIQFSMRLTSAAGLTAFLNQWNSGANQKSFAFDRGPSGVAFQFSYSADGSTTVSALAPGFFPVAGEKYSFMIERDASNDLRIFQGGILIGKTNIGSVSFHNSTEVLRFGGLLGFSSRDMNGIIDEVRIVKGQFIHGSDDRFLLNADTFPRS